MKAHNHYALCPECEREKATLRARVAELEASLRRIAEPSPDVGAFGDWQRGYCERGDIARAALSGAAQPRGEPE
jgi:hypothetical protein